MNKQDSIFLILRIGVAFVFLYPPLSALGSPLTWISYIPDFVLQLPLNEEALLHIIGAAQASIALWILSGRQIFIPSTLASVFIVVLVLFNFAQFEVLFRDVAILAMTVSLAVWSYDPEHKILGF